MRSRPVSRSLTAGLSCLLAVGCSQGVEEARVCEPVEPPVSILVVASQERVRAMSSRRSVPIAASDPRTVVFSDGQVVTSDAEDAGRHLNELGWADRGIEIVGSFQTRQTIRRKRRG